MNQNEQTLSVNTSVSEPESPLTQQEDRKKAKKSIFTLCAFDHSAASGRKYCNYNSGSCPYKPDYGGSHRSELCTVFYH